MAKTLHSILQRADTWRGYDGSALPRQQAIGSGYDSLDNAIGGGWPRGLLTELYCDAPGSGELQLLLPALRQLSDDGRVLFLIDPPWLPYAPALAAAGIDLRRLFIVNTRNSQQLRRVLGEILPCSCNGATLCWPQQSLRQYALLRKLQMTASEGRGLVFLLQETAALKHASPAALRLALNPGRDNMQIEIHKRRGASDGATIELPRPRPPQSRSWEFAPVNLRRRNDSDRLQSHPADHGGALPPDQRLWH